MTSKAIPVDFNNREEDGAVRLNTRGTEQFLAENGLKLSEGAKISMTDGELLAEGTTHERDGIWIAEIERWIDE